MKTLFIECNMGIAGDMLMSALWELIDNKESVLAEINSLGLPMTDISFENAVTCGISATRARVVIDGEEEGHTHHSHHHHHRNLADVNTIIDSLNVKNEIKEKAKAVYQIVAQAEGKVHNADASMVHFHELGMLDAVADIVICSFLFDKLNVDKIIASPINVGSGSVKCAHGILPVPAPATAEILIGIPYYKSNINGELCTPTGAAILKAFCNDFTDMPQMTVSKLGYGIGSKEFEQANCVRTFLGEINENANDEIVELICNIDDMTAEEIAFACEILLDAGAVDVYTGSACMKKSRLGTILTVMCKKENKNDIIKLIFKHTSTIGIREHICARYILNRKIEEVNTPFGVVRSKVSSGYGVTKTKYEYDDLSMLARENNMSIDEVKKLIK
ncbi:MAG: nickel pincer cofactor biosynthesis protein LarC [Eubacterium sp.]|nr:nickel pincer cofactor biosynthesis protein LarC [Eubacterium sp.]